MAMQELLHGKQSSKTSVTAHLTEGQVANIKDGVKNYIAGTTNTLEVLHMIIKTILMSYVHIHTSLTAYER